MASKEGKMNLTSLWPNNERPQMGVVQTIRSFPNRPRAGEKKKTQDHTLS